MLLLYPRCMYSMALILISRTIWFVVPSHHYVTRVLCSFSYIFSFHVLSYLMLCILYNNELYNSSLLINVLFCCFKMNALGMAEMCYLQSTGFVCLFFFPFFKDTYILSYFSFRQEVSSTIDTKMKTKCVSE